jgi:hypothetical protein
MKKNKKDFKMRKVLIATPALNGSVHAWYTDSLSHSIKVCLANGIELFPVILVDESILPMARNELVKIAYDSELESIIFIDSDQVWDVNGLLNVINSEYDVFALPVVSKTDEPGNFNVRIKDLEKIEKDSDGNIKVDSVGTGFLKLSKKAVKSLWDSSSTSFFRGKDLKLVFEYGNFDDEFFGEDIYLCKKLKDLGYDVWINPKYTCGHIGNKMWLGDYSHFLEYICSGEEKDI